MLATPVMVPVALINPPVRTLPLVMLPEFIVPVVVIVLLPQAANNVLTLLLP